MATKRTIRSSALVIVPLGLLFSGCHQAPPSPAPTIAQRADSIARVFETQEAYSPSILDSAGIQAFISGDPGYHEDSAAIVDFYRARSYQYAWFVNDSLGASASNFLSLISATDTAVSAQAAEVGRWSADLNALIEGRDGRPMTDSVRRQTELSLTALFFRVAEARYGGFVQRDLRELDWYIPRHKKNYAMLLDSLVAGVNDLSPIEPVHPQYFKLKAALKHYHDLDTLPWPMIRMPGVRWEPGARDSAVVALRHRLFLLGDAASDTGGTTIDSALVLSVVSAQERFGLRPTGAPDGTLVDELNVPPSERIRTILVNMERMRWMPSKQAPDLILVNIPEFRMHVYEHDTLAWNMDVVVGATATRTVVFSGLLSQVVMAPYWNVPQSIIRSEILPAVKRNAHYLDRKGMEVVKAGVTVPASSIDWKKYSTGVPFTIRQKPGPGNALGKVKFLFPNQYSIYFHDTPAKDKFARDRRAFSHGCIRLSEPARLANYLLQQDSTWTESKVREAMNGPNEVAVDLLHPRPVILGYFTAWVDARGRIGFRDDVYGHDGKLAEELFGQGSTEQTAEAVPVRP